MNADEPRVQAAMSFGGGNSPSAEGSLALGYVSAGGLEVRTSTRHETAVGADLGGGYGWTINVVPERQVVEIAVRTPEHQLERFAFSFDTFVARLPASVEQCATALRAFAAGLDHAK